MIGCFYRFSLSLRNEHCLWLWHARMPGMRLKAKSLATAIPRLLWLLVAALTSCTALLPEVMPGGVLFQDDFSRPVSGWDRYRDEVYEADYEDDAYRIRVITPQTLVWSLPGVDLQDVRVTVEVRSLGGSSNNLYGTICRYENAENFIFFLASSDGYAGIGRYEAGERILLTDESLLPTKSIQEGDAINLLAATCDGRSLTLEINGQLIAQAEVDEAASGDIGLLSGTYDTGDTVIEFDNFSATLP
jgi:hypothetical protein